MQDRKGSNATIELIEFCQGESKKRDPNYILKDYYKPEKSSLSGWVKFINIFRSPGKLKKK